MQIHDALEAPSSSALDEVLDDLRPEGTAATPMTASIISTMPPPSPESCYRPLQQASPNVQPRSLSVCRSVLCTHVVALVPTGAPILHVCPLLPDLVKQLMPAVPARCRVHARRRAELAEACHVGTQTPGGAPSCRQTAADSLVENSCAGSGSSPMQHKRRAVLSASTETIAEALLAAGGPLSTSLCKLGFCKSAFRRFLLRCHTCIAETCRNSRQTLTSDSTGAQRPLAIGASCRPAA